MENGKLDLELDIIVHRESAEENQSEVVCQLSYPEIISHHDANVSRFHLPMIKSKPPPNLPQAPRILNQGVRIHWYC